MNRYSALGFKEVVLTGTQLGSYGFDLPGLSLTRLLAQILSETDVPRLRVSSLQPQELLDDLVGLWEDRRLCPHFHLPLQSGSDAVLERMRRRYTSRQYADAVDTVRRALADVSVTADVVAGFPGETDEEFEETLSLCNEIGFADIHVFPYSVRPGTSAAHYDAQVASETKVRRVHALLELAELQTARFRKRQAGKVRPVLWEQGRRSEGSSLWTGLTDNYIKVSCRSGLDLANRITPARLGKYEEGLVYAEAL
ncbi:MAG TPA: radical SAM protein [Candidatus Latescibacteria bacterium]|nr:radical SAM protein [Candidatus Latescibacterota bacterium]